MTSTASSAVAAAAVPASRLDARVAAAAAFLPGLRGLLSAGTGTAVHGSGRALCVAATGTGAATGPRVLHSRPLGPRGHEIVVLCAVPERPDPVGVSLELLDRALWGEGVLLADMAVLPAAREPGPEGAPDGAPGAAARIVVGLRAVDPAVDPGPLTARLEAWRTAVEARAAGAVAVRWAAAPALPGRRGPG
ncbi:hypothetical protein [Streptomyces sp. NPDC001380]|uniref:hypothetical protein n=1 Tax=Streptomyces sp. NPDC001380 TaxID=3364566 RepID=UPI0036A34713